MPFDHKTNRSHRVAVRGGEFTGPNHLSAEEQRVPRAKRQLRMLKADEAPEGFFGANESRRIVESGADLVPLPKKGTVARLGLAIPRAGVGNGPVTDQVLRFEFTVELFQRHEVLASREIFKSQMSHLKFSTNLKVNIAVTLMCGFIAGVHEECIQIGGRDGTIFRRIARTFIDSLLQQPDQDRLRHGAV